MITRLNKQFPLPNPRGLIPLGTSRRYKTFSKRLFAKYKLCNLCCHFSFAISLRELSKDKCKSPLTASDAVKVGHPKMSLAALSCTDSKALQCTGLGTSTSEANSRHGRKAVSMSIRHIAVRWASVKRGVIAATRVLPSLIMCESQSRTNWSPRLAPAWQPL